MGGDESQKLLPWRGAYSSPGRSKPPAFSNINTLAQRPSGDAMSRACDSIAWSNAYAEHDCRRMRPGHRGHHQVPAKSHSAPPISRCCICHAAP